jgi:hypothetical protein
MAYTTVDDPTIYFNTKLYAGNGSTNAQTGVGFQPDWVWIKNRSASDHHALYDSVRGANEFLSSSRTNIAETTQSDGLMSFNSDGFTVGADGGVNTNSNNFVAWNWKAGGSASSNSNGSITSSVSASIDAGFSIVSWTGNGSAATIGHGLGSAPKVIIIKSRDNAHAWFVGHQSLDANPWTKYMTLENNNAINDDLIWNDTAPTSSVFSVGGYSSTNGSGVKFIGYCFAEKKGYSKFGSYTGNGNNDGVFLHLGFKPAWFLIKSSSNAEQWELVDNKRNTFNPLNLLLYPDQNAAEFTGSTGDRLHCDFVSNGVKLRGNASSANGSGLTYIFMAFAESPFVSSTGIPTTAR